jgi:hypothetical protein
MKVRDMFKKSVIILTLLQKSVQKVTEMDKETRKRFMNVTLVKSNRLKVNPALLMDLVDLEQLDFKAQRSVCWDYGWKSTSPVCLQMPQTTSCTQV